MCLADPNLSVSGRNILLTRYPTAPSALLEKGQKDYAVWSVTVTKLITNISNSDVLMSCHCQIRLKVMGTEYFYCQSDW